MTQALFLESSSGSQDELPYQAGFEKDWTPRKDGGLVYRTIRVWHLVRTTRPQEDIIHGWFSGRIHRKQHNHLDWWTFYIDGASNVKGNRARIILEGPNNITLEKSLKLNFRVRGAHCRSEASKRSRSQEATMLHRLKACPRIVCQHILDQGNSTVT